MYVRRLGKQVTCGSAQMTCTTPSSWAPAANYLLALTRMHICSRGLAWEGRGVARRALSAGAVCAAAEFDYYYHCRAAAITTTVSFLGVELLHGEWRERERESLNAATCVCVYFSSAERERGGGVAAVEIIKHSSDTRSRTSCLCI